MKLEELMPKSGLIYLCPLCKQKFQLLKSLSRHFKSYHHKNYRDWIIQNLDENEKPKCKNCNNFLDLSKKRVFLGLIGTYKNVNYCSKKCKESSIEFKEAMKQSGIKWGKASLGRKATDEAKINMSKAQKELWSDEYRNKMSTIQKEVWSNPDLLSKLSKKIKQSIQNKSEVEKLLQYEQLSKSKIGVKQSKEHTKKIKEGMNTPESRELRSKITTRKWIHGEYKFKKGPFVATKGSNAKNNILFRRSSWELKLLMALELDENVKNYKFNSFSIPYINYQGKLKRYIPDYLVEFTNGSKMLIEMGVKIIKNSYKYIAKLEAGKKYALENNMIYNQWDYSDITKYIDAIVVKNWFINLTCNLEGEMLAQIIFQKKPFSKIEIDLKKSYQHGVISIPLDLDRNEFNTNSFKSQFRDYLLSFYPQFFDCKSSKSRFTPNDCIKNLVPLRHALALLGEQQKQFTWENFMVQLRSERYGVSWFRPNIAKYIYKRYLKDIEKPKVLDPTGGWGARLLAFHDLYPIKGQFTYVDAWKENIQSTKNLIKSLQSDNIYTIEGYFEDIPFKETEKFDLIFTSIPFEKKEIYGDVMNKYINWESEFLVPFIKKVKQLSDIILLDCDKETKEKIAKLTLIKEEIVLKSTSHFNDTSEEKNEYIIRI
jgi:hypothetical protein